MPPEPPADEPSPEHELLVTQVYESLRRIARGQLAALPPGQTLQATALVHEAWLKLSAAEHDLDR